MVFLKAAGASETWYYRQKVDICTHHPLRLLFYSLEALTVENGEVSLL